MKRGAGITCALPLRMKQTQLERERKAAQRATLDRWLRSDGPTIAFIASMVGLLLLLTSWLK